MLKDYLVEQPVSVIEGTVVNEVLVKFPGCVDTLEFGKRMRPEIDKEELTPEKAIYVASKEPRAKLKTSKDLLNSRLRF